MPRPRKAPPRPEDLPTIWEIPDALWARIGPIIAALDPPKPTGRPRIDARRALEAILFRLRSGCQWNHLPQDLPDDSSVHRTFQRWIALGVFDRLWAELVAACAELGGVDWEWQAADGALGKARLGGLIGRNPTDRGKRGVKRSLLVEASGGPLAVRRDCRGECSRHQAPGGHPGSGHHEAAAAHPGASPASLPGQDLRPPNRAPHGGGVWLHAHIRRIGEETLDPASGEKRFPARRWVVERTLAWLSKCRALLLRYDRYAANFLGLLKLAGALVWYRRLHRLSLLR
jgi:putative transposase